MEWYKIDIETEREKSEEVSDFLLDMGCNGCQITDPEEIGRFIKELDTLEYADSSLLNSCGDSITITGYLPGNKVEKEVVDALSHRYKGITISIVRDEEWEDNGCDLLFCNINSIKYYKRCISFIR
jgi:ribosomal protein L11 methylase PrmA